jgi:hypothetical protein
MLGLFEVNRESLNERFAAERPSVLPLGMEGTMFGSGTILIVDESSYGGLDLSETIEELDGFVAGPVSSVSEALTILDSTELCGAIVDFDLPDAGQFVMLLIQRNIPAVVQICTTMHQSLPDLGGKVAVLTRPVEPRMILDSLLIEMGKSQLSFE